MDLNTKPTEAEAPDDKPEPTEPAERDFAVHIGDPITIGQVPLIIIGEKTKRPDADSP